MQKYGNEIKKTAIKIIDGGFFNFKIIEKDYPPKSSKRICSSGIP